MKLAVSLNLELPDSYAEMTDAELRETLYTEIQSTLECAHLETALDAVGKVDALVEHHKLWATIIKNATMALGKAKRARK
jgi:hypothetical protein